MGTYRKSVAAPGRGAGAAKPKKGNVTVIFAEDVLSFPERDANGVKMIGNIVLVAGAKMHQLYMTPSTQKLSDEITGDEDMEAFAKKAEAIHPGNSLEIREFRANTLGIGVILIFGAGCGVNSGDVFGTPCNPMKLKGSYSSDNEGVKNTMMYEALIADATPIGSYDGEVTLDANYVSETVALDLSSASDVVQQLPSLGVTDAITVATILGAHADNKTIITLIGGGGADPATLSNGVQGNVTFVLKDATTWVALDKAVINFYPAYDGTTFYLIEQSRA
jgi:hypothetical protein